MNNILNKRGLIEAILVGIIAVIFAISFVYSPPLLLLTLLLPTPFIVLVSRHGVAYGYFSLIIPLILISILIDPVFAIVDLMVFVPMALSMGHLIRKRHEEFSVIAMGTAITVFATFLMIQVYSFAFDVNVMDEITALLQEAIGNQTEMLMSMNFQVNNIKDMVDTFMMVFPGVVVVHSILVSFINYFTSGAILKKLGNKELGLPEFSNYKLPGNIVLGSFIIMILTYLTGFFEGIYTNTLMANVLVIFTFIFFTQGMAFISFLLEKLKFPKPFRIAVLLLIVIISPLLTLIALMGLIDSVFDMRRLRTR